MAASAIWLALSLQALADFAVFFDTIAYGGGDVVGSNRSGKSTLLGLLAGLVLPTVGTAACALGQRDALGHSLIV